MNLNFTFHEEQVLAYRMGWIKSDIIRLIIGVGDHRLLLTAKNVWLCSQEGEAYLVIRNFFVTCAVLLWIF